jgi:biopolymer transport protein ExbD
MGMNVGGGSEDGEVMVDINTTPLIDVMLVLLIMFIITIPVQTHAVKMNMPVPNNSAPPPKPPTIVRIDVDFDGTISWSTGEGSEIIPSGDRASIESHLAGVAALADQPEVHLRPNKLVTYKHVALIMATAQRLGVTKIGIVGNEQFL